LEKEGKKKAQLEEVLVKDKGRDVLKFEE